MLKPVVWDSRKCHVGEGLVAIGEHHSSIYWVDILNDRVLWRNLDKNASGYFGTSENISFVLPRTNGGFILGTAHGPEAMDPKTHELTAMPTRFDADGSPDPIPMRWNDAKVGPAGEIWMGTSAYGADTDRIGLHRLSADGKLNQRILSEMKLSNGMDWSPDSRTYYLIDTVALTLFVFDYEDGQISNQRVGMDFDPGAGEYPDGMTVDSEGSLWIAFWNGGCIRKYSPQFKLLDTINFPVRFVSSCAFAGPELKTLVVTTAVGDNGWHDDHDLAGMTFILDTDVAGKASYVFPS